MYISVVRFKRYYDEKNMIFCSLHISRKQVHTTYSTYVQRALNQLNQRKIPKLGLLTNSSHFVISVSVHRKRSQVIQVSFFIY